MKNVFKFFGNLNRAQSAKVPLLNLNRAHRAKAPLLIIAFVAVIGFSLAACDDDKGGGNNNNSSNNNNSGNNNSGGKIEKSIKITGLDDFYGSSYQLGLASTVDKLYDEDLVAFAEGTIRSATQTAPLLDYKTGNPWTGSGSYYVGVYLYSYGKKAFVTRSKKAFNSSVTTLCIDDFDYD